MNPHIKDAECVFCHQAYASTLTHWGPYCSPVCLYNDGHGDEEDITW